MPRILVVIPELIAYYRGVVAGVARYCRTHNLVAAYLRPEALHELPETPADGIIAAVSTAVVMAAVRQRQVPVVNVSSRLREVPFPSVRIDHRAVGVLAAEHFLHRGFRSFAYVYASGPWYAQVRGQMFAERLAAAGHACRVFELGPDTASDRCAARLRKRFPGFIDALPGPIAVLAATDYWGWQIIDASHNAGLEIPGRLAVLGVDNDQMLCEMANPSLSSIDVAADRVGFGAADLVARLIAGEAAPREPLLVAPAQVVVRSSSDTVGTTDADVAAALRLIREHVGEPYQVEDLLAALPLSRRTLERRFETALGHSPAKEIRRVKMDRARQLLAETDMPLRGIARAVGFEYLSHFTAVFRQEAAMPPSAYRRSLRLP